MAKYETIVLLDPNLGEAQVKDEQKKIEDLFKANGATSVSSDRWGKRPLSYQMGKHSYATYVWFGYDSEVSSVVSESTNVLRLSDLVLKFQTHRIYERVRKFKGNPKRLTEPQVLDEDMDLGELEY